ncbi:MAG: Ada metal-binding domain-containing protein [Gammaproteobacteria bacterium]
MHGMPAHEIPSVPEADRYYRALVAHDARFDGRFYVAVTSTGIYCRPVCRVRTPKRSNCRFFLQPAAAERAGFRPCLRCRPELAPGLSLQDSSKTLAGQTALLIERAAVAGEDPYMPAIAKRLGVTDRHLRRIFLEVHGVSPIEFLTTRRLLLAKQLLTDTRMPVTQVALASGFASVRRFNAVFRARYRLSPSELRGEGLQNRHPQDPAASGELVSVRLGYRPPYDIDGTLEFFRTRSLPGVETVAGSTLRRTLALRHQGQLLQGWVGLRFVPDRHEVWLVPSPALVPAIGLLLARARQALDLDADPALIDPVLATCSGA